MIRFDRFRGERWLIDLFALGRQFATTAFDCWLANGSLDPLKRGYIVPGTETEGYSQVQSFFQFEDKLMTSYEDTPFIESVGVDEITRRVYFLDNNLMQHYDYDEVPAGVPTDLILGHRVGVPAPSTQLDVPTFFGLAERTVGPRIRTSLADTNPVLDTEYEDADVYVTTVLYTFVNKYGEEGEGSFASNDAYIRSSESILSLSYIVVKNSIEQWPDVVGIRVYYAIDGGYELVSNSTLESGTVGGLTHVITDAERTTGAIFFDIEINRGQSNEIYVSQGWAPPPENMKHLVDIGNGMNMGADDYNLYFNEPYFPHAWPTTYRKPIADKIIGLAPTAGGAIVFTTKGALPLIGNSPEYMQERPFKFPHPVRDKRSITTMDDGSVLYATDEGLALVSINSAEIITDGWIDREVWLEKVTPSECRTGFYEGRIVMVTRRPSDGVPVGYIFNLQQAEITEFTTSTETLYVGFFRQPLNNELWYVLDQEAGLAVFNRGDPQRYIWESGRIELSHAESQSTGRAEISEYIDAPDQAQLTIIAEDRETSRLVTSNKKFRIRPTGRKYWIKVRLEAQRRWSFLRIGQNLGDV